MPVACAGDTKVISAFRAVPTFARDKVCGLAAPVAFYVIYAIHCSLLISKIVCVHGVSPKLFAKLHHHVNGRLA